MRVRNEGWKINLNTMVSQNKRRAWEADAVREGLAAYHALSMKPPKGRRE